MLHSFEKKVILALYTDWLYISESHLRCDIETVASLGDKLSKNSCFIAQPKVFFTAGFLHFYPVKTTLYVNVYKEKYVRKHCWQIEFSSLQAPLYADSNGCTFIATA